MWSFKFFHRLIAMIILFESSLDAMQSHITTWYHTPSKNNFEHQYLLKKCIQYLMFPLLLLNTNNLISNCFCCCFRCCCCCFDVVGELIPVPTLLSFLEQLY